MVDEATKKTLAAIPLLKIRAGPRDKDQWVGRLKEEYMSLIKVKFITIQSIGDNINVHTVYLDVLYKSISHRIQGYIIHLTCSINTAFSNKILNEL